MNNTDTVRLKLTRNQVNDVLLLIHTIILTLEEETDPDQAENVLGAIENRWSPLADAIAKQLNE